MLLAIDTSTTLTGLALYTGDATLAECSWESGRQHTAQLLTQIDLLLQHSGRSRTDLRAVAVALGPGSWSGLRVGLSLAKGLALAGNLSLVGIGTLEALAYQYHPLAAPIYPLIRLGRGRFATAEFHCRSGCERRSPDRNTTLSELCAGLQEPAFFCGDLDAKTRAQLQRETASQALFPAPAAALRRPAFLAELGWQRLQHDEPADIATLEPIYLSDPVAAKPGSSS
jgi:tRNA threonylcarbamoyladenosine biosynthesis protein TsaB